MKRIDPEFAFQARELESQIDDTLGDPPNHKNYRMVIDALLSEYTKGAFVEDVNLLSFALVEHLRFNDPQGLLASAETYQAIQPDETIAMVSSGNPAAQNMLAAISKTNPELARQAIIVAFLHKNRNLWIPQESAPEEDEEKEENQEDDIDEGGTPSEDVIGLFDKTGGGNDG